MNRPERVARWVGDANKSKHGTWPASPGNYTMTRATDEAGNTQPDRVPWNDQGYLYHAVVPHPVQIV